LISASKVSHIETNISGLNPVNGSLNETIGHNMIESFRVFVGTLTGIQKISDNKALTFDIYPNPLKENELTIHFQSPLDSPEIALFDISGKLVLKQILAGKQNIYAVKIPSLNSGEYFIQIKEKNLVVFKNKVLIKL
jgi:hypothetical protein